MKCHLPYPAGLQTLRLEALASQETAEIEVVQFEGSVALLQFVNISILLIHTKRAVPDGRALGSHQRRSAISLLR